ncbi:MAG: hypothetical protein WCE63_07630 [Acidobacteriaceae bacterium]
MQALNSDFIPIPLACRRASHRQRISIRRLASILVFALLCCLCSVAPLLQAQNLYTDPAGAFTVMVPANWQVQRTPGNPLISFTNEKYFASISMGVIHGDAATTPTANKELEMIQNQFPENCPKASVQKRGRTTISGVSGAFLLVNCKNSKGNLLVSKPATIDFKMTLGAVTQTVNVSAETETLNTTDATLGNAVAIQFTVCVNPADTLEL